MVKKVLAVLFIILAALGVGLYFSYTSETLFFDTIPWVILVAIVLGLVLGAVRAILRKKLEIVGDEVERHDSSSFLEHWGTSIGIFTLIASGILLGFLFIPGFIKTLTEAIVPLNMHFTGLVITLFSGCYFLADYVVARDYDKLIPNIPDIIGGTVAKYLLRRKWTAEDKYLSSQKSAFLAFAVLGAFVLITGAIKVAAHIWHMQATAYAVTTFFHDIFSLLFILLLIVHVLLVVVLKAHWSSLVSWVTGKAKKDYVEHEHPVWNEELETGVSRGYKLMGYKEASEVEK